MEGLIHVDTPKTKKKKEKKEKKSKKVKKEVKLADDEVAEVKSTNEEPVELKPEL